MARVKRMQSSNTNPAERFYEWKSEHQKFGYWDKAKGEKGEFVFEELPFRFLALTNYKTVTGFNSKYKGGGTKGTAVRSNEVKDLKDNIKVYYLDPDKTVIAEGPWTEIKEKTDNASGKFALSVYSMLPDGSLVNLRLSGAAVGAWFDFSKNQSDLFFDNWVEVKSFKKGKQGSVQFTFPVFSFGKRLSAKEELAAEECDKKIESYEEHYFGQAGGTSFDSPGDSAVDGYNKARDMNVQEPEVVGEDGELDF